VDGDSLSFNGAGELEVNFPVAGSGKKGSIKATSSYMTVDGDGDITSLTADTAATATNFTGSLAGEVTGSQGSTVVSKIMGANVDTVTPTVVNQIIKWDGTKWYAGSDSTVGGGAVDTVTNYGGGQEVMKDKVGTEVRFRTLVGVDGIAASTNGDTVEVGIDAASDVIAGSLTTSHQAGILAGPHNTTPGATGEIRFQELAANGTDSVGFKSPDLLAADLTWTLPDVAGTSGQALGLTGAGTLGWIDANTGGSTQIAGAGAVGNPSYTFSGDTDTGLYSSGADTVNIATGGVNRLSVVNSGNVGIGTTSPTQLLEVSGGGLLISRADGALGPTLSDVGNSLHVNRNVKATFGVWVRNDGTNLDYGMDGSTNRRLHLFAGGNALLGIDSVTQGVGIGSGLAYGGSTLVAPANGLIVEGNVGIGTTDPNHKIDVQSAVGPIGQVRALGTTYGTQDIFSIYSERTSTTTDHNLLKASSSAVPNAFSVQADGRVAIGTSSPSAALHVNDQIGVGVADTTAGIVTLFGDGTASTSGGSLVLASAADHDTTYNYYHINVFEDDMRMGRAGSDDLTIASDGNVGIGTTSPSEKLSVNGNIDMNYGVLDFGGMASDHTYQILITPNTLTYDAYNNHLFRTGDDGSEVDRMIIKSNGNVGIGTTTPVTGLHVKGAGVSGTGTFEKTGANTGGALTGIDLVTDAKTAGDNSLLGYSALDSADNLTSYSKIKMGIEDPTNGSEDGFISFNTVSNGAYADRMTITAAGNVGIGTTDPSSILDINGAITTRNMAAPAVSPAGQGRIYFDSSDNKYKVSQNGSAYADLVGGSSIKVYSARIASNCSVSAEIGGDWLASTADTGTGRCDLTLQTSPAAFSSAPACTCTGGINSGFAVKCSNLNPSDNTKLELETKYGGGTSVDAAFEIICVGP
jgi:hypothetical protein